MKKTQEILGLPIISISDGMEVGKVKSIIINADKGAIDYIIVDSGIQIHSAKVILTDNILGIGEYALTIENESAINDISKIPAAIDLLQKDIQVKGTKVLTKKGKLIGGIGDIYVEENDCCKITGLEFIADITQKNIRIIPRESVITFGKNLIVVKDDIENMLVDEPTQLASAETNADVEKKNLAPFESGDAVLNELIVNTDIPKQDEINTSFNDIGTIKEQVPVAKTEVSEDKINAAIESVIGAAVETTEASNAANLFEQRQRQYLKGRIATKTITDNSGEVIVNDGAVINDEIIDSAKASGKLIELVMNNRA